MRLVTQKPRGIDVLVIEDLSRLSRAAADLFTLQRLFEFLEIRLIGVADGIDTFAKHSTLTFGLKSLVSTIYLSDLRDKTIRGLEGRALAGLATGGVAFGYALRKETGPDGKSSGTRIEVVEERAAVVRRIFGLYLEGHSLGGIAKTLNEEAVPPPRVDSRTRRAGWKDSTVRAMLHNESYIGRWRYKSSQWRKVPGTNRRVPVRRADPQAIVSERPSLRIIDDATWRAVQDRLTQVRRFYTRTTTDKPKGRALPGKQATYLFSSLLVCGVCGSKMVVSGGSNDAYYRCEGHAKRGICPNALSVRESVVRANILDELRRRLFSDQGIAYARKKLAERLGELERDRDSELRAGRQKLAKLERQIAHLIDFIADGGRSPGLADKLRGLENEAESERARAAALAKQSVAAIPLPAPEDLMEMVFDLEKRLLGDPTRGREELRCIFRDGRITLVPEPGGFYVARSEILPLVLLTQTPSAVGDRGGRYTALCCAGAQLEFSDQQDHGVAEVWVPFEEEVAVGWR
jgi:DNA invertase Pin-like site-specific DNA recombinase